MVVSLPWWSAERAGTLWTCWIVRWIAAAMRQRPTTMFGLSLTGMTFLRLTLTSWSANALSSQISQGPPMRSGLIRALSSGRFCICGTVPRPWMRGSANGQLTLALDRELGLSYRKNMDGLYEALGSRRGEAARNAKKLGVHHDALGEPKPSRRNPSTRVGEIFDELEPYLGNDLG